MEKKEQNKWNNFFLDLRERGRCTFTFDDIRENFDLSEQSISLELYRYSVKKQIVKIRKGFYGILTPETSIGGMLPPDLFVDALMKSLNKPYYVALLSAAALPIPLVCKRVVSRCLTIPTISLSKMLLSLLLFLHIHS